MTNGDTRGCTTFRRQRSRIVAEAAAGKHPWLVLPNGNNDVVFTIGGVRCRFSNDDPGNPSKDAVLTASRYQTEFLEFASPGEPGRFCFITDRGQDGKTRQKRLSCSPTVSPSMRLRNWRSLLGQAEAMRSRQNPATRAPVCYCHTVLGRCLMPASPAAVLSVRVNASERALLEAAAEQASTSLSDFVRRRALEAAEIDLLNRRILTIPAKDWARFEAWAHSPAREVPGLRKLSKTRPVWQK